jgi:hypothetical protein
MGRVGVLAAAAAAMLFGCGGSVAESDEDGGAGDAGTSAMAGSSATGGVSAGGSTPLGTGGTAATGATAGMGPTGATGGTAGCPGRVFDGQTCVTEGLVCLDSSGNGCICTRGTFDCSSAITGGTGGITPTGGTGGTVPVGGASGAVPTGGSGGTGATGAAGGTPPTGGVGGTGASGGVAGSAGTGGEAGEPPTGGTGGEPPVGECILVVPDSLSELEGSTFFDHPWPSDLRRDADGFVELDGFPNPRPSTVLASYITEVDNALLGFSPAAAGYLRFTAPIDEASLPPDPPATLDADSSVQLLDVDPNSPTVGQRHPVSVVFRAAGDGYWPDNTLAFMPMPGLPLQPATRYALVVTDALAATTGRLGACSSLIQVLGLDDASGSVASLRDDWADAVARVEAAGIELSRIVHLTVFTTNDPVGELLGLRDWVVDNYAAPGLLDLAAAEQTADLIDIYEGTYGPSPDFQQGTPPFLASGGALALSQSGTPTVQREFDLRFVLGVPSSASCPMPAAGFPIALYGHGTGGDYRSVVRSGVGDLLAARCIATLGIDQIFHGTRPGGPCDAGAPDCNVLNDEALAVFNAFNPASMRGSNRQAAIDVVQQARLVTESNLVVAASVSRTGQAISFDPANVLLMAHSQGATSSPLALAADDQLRGGVLSGSAAMASISLLERTEPQDLGELIATELYGSDSATVDEFHPAISLVQTNLDVGDPVHYAALTVDEPRAGFAAKSVLMIEGVGADGSSDSYVSSHAIELHAVAMGLPPVAPVLSVGPELGWSGLGPLTVAETGVTGNLAAGAASGALVQWQAPAGEDPHFVFFDVPEANAQAAAFLGYLAADPVGRIPPR